MGLFCVQDRHDYESWRLGCSWLSNDPPKCSGSNPWNLWLLPYVALKKTSVLLQGISLSLSHYYDIHSAPSTRCVSFSHTKQFLWHWLGVWFLLIFCVSSEIIHSKYLKGANLKSIIMQCPSWDFPGSPVVKMPHFQCRGPRFNPWSGNFPTCHNYIKNSHVWLRPEFTCVTKTCSSQINK